MAENPTAAQTPKAASPSGESARPQRRYFVRLNKHERLQHITLMIAFTLLVITGFTLQLSEDWLRKIGASGYTYEVRSLLHRIAGIIMIIICLSHVLYVLFWRPGKKWLRDMLPRWRDLREARENMLFYLGRRKRPPRFDRFNYKEKVEYWALIAGSTLMSLTGLIMMYEAGWSRLIVQVSALVHRMEAVLACLAIIIWHFYEVHLRPGKFPHSKVWWTGLMSEEEMEEEHPEHLERLLKERRSRHDVIHHGD